MLERLTAPESSTLELESSKLTLTREIPRGEILPSLILF